MTTRHTARKTTALMVLLAAAVARAEDGAASPEDMVKKAQEAQATGKISSMVPLVHPDDRPLLGFAAMMMASFSMMGAKDQAVAEKELEAVQAKHGVKEPPKDAPPPANDAEMTMRMRQMFKGVDMGAYCRDMEGLADKHGTKGEGQKAPGPGKIENVKVEGDQATVTLDGKPGRMSRVNGRWYLRLDK